MKKIQLISALVLVVMALCSCTNTDYQKVIPANATVVVKADMKSISEKADFKDSKYKQMLDESLSAVVKGKDMDAVKAYIDDPMKMGIDLSMPLYFFMAGEETVGLTMKVGNEDDVKDFLQLLNKQGMASKPQEKDGQMCGTLVDDIYYSYDKNTFLMLASLKGSGTSATSRMARELMTLKEDDSFISTDAFDRMNDEEQDVVCYTNLNVLPKNMLDGWKVLLPENISANDIDFISSLDFEDGAASLKLRVCGKTDEAKKVIEEEGKNFGNIKGKFLERTSDDMLLWLGVNMKGEWLMKQLKKSRNVKELLFMMERVVDIEQMINAVDGDVAVEYPMEGLGSHGKPDYRMYAEVKNTDFLADVKDWMATSKEYGMTYREVGNNKYVAEMDGETFTWGVEDNVLYSSNGQVAAPAKGSNPLEAYKKDIQNSRFFMFVNLEKLPLEQMGRSADMPIRDALSSLKAIVLKSADVDELTLTVALKDKNENFLKQLLK